MFNKNHSKYVFLIAYIPAICCKYY